MKEFLIAFLFLDFLLIGTFCILDLLLFYIFFESVLIPMYLIVGVWGSRDRKILAAYYFFLYTLLGSVVMLLSILYIYNQVGTNDYEILLTFVFSDFVEKVLFVAGIIPRFVLVRSNKPLWVPLNCAVDLTTSPCLPMTLK